MPKLTHQSLDNVVDLIGREDINWHEMLISDDLAPNTPYGFSAVPISNARNGIQKEFYCGQDGR